MSSVKKDNYYLHFIFPTCIHFSFLCYWNNMMQYSTILKKSGAREYPWSWKGKTVQSFTVEYYISQALKDAFIKLRSFLLIFRVFFSHELYLYFVKWVFCINWSDHIILLFSLLCWIISMDFQILNQPCIPGIN